MERRGKRSGQAILEYMLLLIVLFGVVALLNTVLGRVRETAWKAFMCEIAAPCYGCKVPDPTPINRAFPNSNTPCD
jgi:hypothetical protein